MPSGPRVQGGSSGRALRTGGPGAVSCRGGLRSGRGLGVVSGYGQGSSSVRTAVTGRQAGSRDRRRGRRHGAGVGAVASSTTEPARTALSGAVASARDLVKVYGE